MKKILNSPVFNGVLILLIAFLVVRLSLNQNFDDTFRIISSANFSWVIFGLLIIALMYLAWGYALVVYANLLGHSLSLVRGSALAVIGAFGSGITPSSTGGQLFQLMAIRKMGVNVADAASILWIDFLIYQIVMIVMVLALLLFRLSHFLGISGLFTMVIIGFILNSFVLVFLFILAKSNKFHNWVANRGIHILHRFKLIKSPERTLSKIEKALKRFTHCLDILIHNKKVVFLGIVMNIIRLLLLFSFPYIIAKALKAPITYKSFYDVLALSSFVMMINVFIPLPGASGGTELTFVGMFSTIIESSYLTPLMLIWRFMTYYLVMIVGAIWFIYYKRKVL